MISSVGSQSEGLKDLFFKQQFPELKEELLLKPTGRKKQGTAESTPAADSGVNASLQSTFSEVMRGIEGTETPDPLARDQDAREAVMKASAQAGQTIDPNNPYELLERKAQYRACY